MKKVLALAPHTDDIELGCGGFLSKLSSFPAATIHAVAFTSAQPLSKGNPVEEFRKAMGIAGIPNHKFVGLEPRKLPSQRQKVLDYLWDLNQKSIEDGKPIDIGLSS